MNLKRRVELLEGTGAQSSLGDMLDALAAEDNGEAVEWTRMTINPALVRALGRLDDGNWQ